MGFRMSRSLPGFFNRTFDDLTGTPLLKIGDYTRPQPSGTQPTRRCIIHYALISCCMPARDRP